MNINNRTFWIIVGIVLSCGFLLFVGILFGGLRRLASPASPPTVDLFATLSASTPGSAISSEPISSTATSEFNFSSPAQTPSVPDGTGVPPVSSQDDPTGHIVFTCQIYKVQSAEQICIMKADGTGFRRLTTNDGVRHFYPSLSLDGNTVLYAAFRESNVYEIYAYALGDGSVDRLTNRIGVLNAPEVSPNGQSITFKRWNPATDRNQIMIMDRNGDNPHNIPLVEGWDPTWSPDGKQILFASDRNGPVQLFVVKENGKGLNQISNLPAIRGRNDWSPDGGSIVTYSGGPWQRELFLMNADGSNTRQLTPSGGNSQGPSFSPDGQWVAFTAYFDKYNDIHGCEIYIIRTDGTDLRRLTANDYCDYQPRWGP